MSTRIWFTKGLSNTGEAIALMHADPAAQGLVFVASHDDADNSVRAFADIFLEEPKAPRRAAYADWVLEHAIRHHIALVVVQRHATALSEARERFDAHGVRLQIAAAPEVRAVLDNKIAFQSDIASPEVLRGGVVGHPHSPFRTLSEFDAAWVGMTEAGLAPDGLCAKPAQAIFGAGFRLIEEASDELARILSGDSDAGFRISLAAYRAALAGAAAPVQQLLMPFLPGIERSVDFVACDGQLLCAVVRVKMGKFQLLETSGPSVEMARVLAARYRLNGLCNLQTREDGAGREAVLEINPRMSGGMALACLSGVNLPLMSVLAGLGRDLSGFGVPVGGQYVQFQQVARIVPI
jgi:hypothetical protein